MKQVGMLGRFDLYKADYSELKDGMKAILKGNPLMGTLKKKKDFFIFVSDYGSERIYPNSNIDNSLTIAVDKWND